MNIARICQELALRQRRRALPNDVANARRVKGRDASGNAHAGPGEQATWPKWVSNLSSTSDSPSSHRRIER
jgi:hypothetical protein